MIEIIGANKKTGERFSLWFERPCKAISCKKALEKSKYADYIGWFNY